MRQLVFIGFFCGPIGLGLALFQSLRRVGESIKASWALRAGAVLWAAEVACTLVLPINLLYFHVAGGVLGKLAHDRWLLRASLRYTQEGGREATRLHLGLFCAAIAIGWLAVFFLLDLIVVG